MHYFTLNSRDNTHLGFLVMLEDEEMPTEHGCFAVKAQAQAAASSAGYPAEWAVLRRLAAEEGLVWRRQGERIRLLNAAGEHIGHWQQQHIRLLGQDFVVNDLSGVL